jgi:hypothetical protein
MEVLFEQTYLSGRVLTLDGEWVVQFGVLGGKTVELLFDKEIDAKVMYAELEKKYLEALNKLQEVVISLA